MPPRDNNNGFVLARQQCQLQQQQQQQRRQSDDGDKSSPGGRTSTSSSCSFSSSLSLAHAAAVVFDRPYLPNLSVNPDDADGVRAGAAAVLVLLLVAEEQRRIVGGAKKTPTPLQPPPGLDSMGGEEEQLLARVSRHWTVEAVGGGVTNRLFRVSNIHFHNLTQEVAGAGKGEGDDEAGTGVGEAAAMSSASSRSPLLLPSLLSSSPSSCLVRVFGAEGMIDRDVETMHFARLAAQGLAPPYYGRLKNARVEGWCDNMRPLEVEELRCRPDIRRGIAAEMAKLHALYKTTGDNSGGDGSTKEEEEKDVLSAASEEEDKQDVVLWTQLDEWCASAVGALTESSSAASAAVVVATADQLEQEDADDPPMLLLPVETIPAELRWIRKRINVDGDGGATAQDSQSNDASSGSSSEPALPSGGRLNGNQCRPRQPLEVAFCHNDVLAANVLVDDATSRIQLIDFEYGGYNYVAFDIANHWNEYAGGPPHTANPNYEWLPSPQDQADFVAAYLEARRRFEDKKATTRKDDDAMQPARSEDVDDDEVAQLLHDVRAFVLVNHLYWGLWAVNQARTEGCREYDYATYALKRFEQYVKLKRELVGGGDDGGDE